MFRKFFLGLNIILCLVLLSLLLLESAPTLAAAPSGLHVVGNTLRNGSNQVVRLLGVNRSGTEFACIQNNGIFDGPSDSASVQQIVNWHANAIRIPLNEDCWLNVNTSGINASFVGTPYQQAVINYVNLVNSLGLVAIVELHWSAPGTTQAKGQANMPDADHSSTFWTQVANTFKNNSSVVFDLFNEPFPDGNQDTTAAWNCWKNGGACGDYNQNGVHVTYTAVGFQSLVNTVRATGATNVIMIGGVEFSNSLSQWLANKPTDSTGNLAAAWHVYNFNLCNNTSCWNGAPSSVAAQVPLVTGEIGENDCAHGFIDSLMSFLDSKSASYLGWTWNAWDCSSGPSLISDYNGTATNFGIGFKNHLAAIVGGTPTPVTPSPTTTRTPTPGGPTPTPPPGNVRMRIQNGGSDNTQQSQFHFQIANTGSTSQTNLSFRAYFTLDSSQPASKYVFEKYWDESAVAVVSGPTLASGSTYYFTVSYGTKVLPAGGSWQYHGALHLNDWTTNFTAANDFWHTGYALGALPASFTDDTSIPAFVSTSKVWGNTP